MKWQCLFWVILLPGIVYGVEMVVNPKIDCKPPIHGMLPMHNGNHLKTQMETPPQTDSIHYVVASVDYGGPWSSPLNYPNADHIVRRLGTYNVPYIFYETGPYWHYDCIASSWCTWFPFLWVREYVTPIGPEDTLDTGRICAAADTFGNIHIVWHGPILPTDTVCEVWYRKKSDGAWRTAILLSANEGVMDAFPVVTVDGDCNVTAVWTHGDIGEEEDLYARRSTDCGEIWGPTENISDFAAIMSGSWILPSIDCDPTTGDVHVVCNTDMNSDNWMDIFYAHYDAASGTWDPIETVAEAVAGGHPFGCPQVVVDSENLPHVVYQENLSDQGGREGLSGWPECGPVGMSYYTYKPKGDTWRTPQEIFSTSTGGATGYPDLGIDQNGYFYLVYTQPSCFGGDAYYYEFPWASFNVFYSVKAPGSTQWTPRELVSRVQDPHVDTSCIYPQTNKNVPADGPEIAWCQLVGQAPPSVICYNHETPGLPPAGDVAVEWTWPDSDTWGDIQVGDTIFPRAVFRCVSWEKQRTNYFMDGRFELWLRDSLVFDWQRLVPDVPPGSVSDTVECGLGIIVTDPGSLDSLRIKFCAIKANDTNPSNDCVEVPGSVGVEEQIQTEFFVDYLLKNQPNPFVQSTSITFFIPIDERVTVEIYDAAGRLACTLIDRKLQHGFHSIEWDGLDDCRNRVPSGIYFYRLLTSQNHLSRKMILLK